MNITDEVKNFIIENFLFGDESRGLEIDDSFYEKGIVDSTGVLSIINFIEERFGIAVSDSEITPENLDSVGRIAAYVERKSKDVTV